MATFSIHTRPHDEGRPPKIVEVELCLRDFALADNGLPVLTPLCITEEGVEVQFERVISEIRKKKSEAKAIIRKSDDAHRH